MIRTRLLRSLEPRPPDRYLIWAL